METVRREILFTCAEKENEKGKMRLDKFLAREFSFVSRVFLREKVDQGKVLVNDKKVKPNYLLKNRDKILANFEFKDEPLKLMADDKVELEIVFQNEDFLILAKPMGISVHPSFLECSGTLSNGLLAKFPFLAQVGEDALRPGIVHRLDKETSGLLLVALNNESFKIFKEKFANREIEKKYLLVCFGEPEKTEGEIDFWIGKSKKNPALQNASLKKTQLINPKEAKTFYKVLKKFEYFGSKFSLVECFPRTGRKHQIRVHFWKMGHPILGDKKYFNKSAKNINELVGRMMLHAVSLNFEFKKNKYEVTSLAPNDFLIF